LLTLIISDAPGDDPAIVASGPTIGDPSTFAQAREILRKYGVNEPLAVLEHLDRAQNETPKPGDPVLAASGAKIIAAAQMSLEAAAFCAQEAGVAPLILGDAIEGEARDVGRGHGALALRYLKDGHRPCVLLSGGETTVTVRGGGRGGRNVEFLLALACALRGQAGVHAIAADTDGIDGAGPAAGGLIGPDTWARARHQGIDAAALLADNDAHAFFECLGDAVVTGPTHTNVNDFRAILVDAES
jgi:hydroxypyruvate reductase